MDSQNISRIIDKYKNKTIDFDTPIHMTKNQNWGPGEFSMTLDSVGINANKKLGRSAAWKQKLF